MPRPRKPSADLPSAFIDQLAQALDHFGDAAWLGDHSPLAAPYFLGEALLHQPSTPESDTLQRGQTLQRLLQDTAATLPPQACYAPQRLLTVAFFRPEPLPESLLFLSRTTYYRYRREAVELLAAALIRRLTPALRLETPIAPSALFGRDDLLEHCRHALADGQSVSLIGPGGIGKTTLGAALAHTIAPRATFWCTLRPGLNDQLSHVLFALGFFLQQRGAAGLWLQLTADAGHINLAVALGLLRHALAGPPPSMGEGRVGVVLCFDELDLLRPSEVEAHAQLMTFLESLRGLAPLLVIGQQPLIETDLVCTLPGLPLSASVQLLRQAGIALPAADLERLQAFTHGNPRLLELFIALHRTGEPLTEVLAHIPALPSLEFLLNRIWQRLAEAERALLAALAVFRRPAPQDPWPDQAALTRLIDRRLAQADAQGGVEVLPAFKALLEELIAPETRETLHGQTAEIWAARGAYTEAAYHYLKARRPSLAVRLWYDHRWEEINQGQAGAALRLFADLSRDLVRGADREKLSLLRSELWNLTGDYGRAREELRSSLWRTPILRARARRLEGDMAEVAGEFDRARRAYQDGLQTVETALESEVAQFHKNLGWVYLRQSNLEQAWREALLARYEAVNLQGYVQEQLGQYAAARRYYLEALALAETLHHAQGEAKTRRNLAVLLARQSSFAEAEAHWQAASRHFERIGDLTNLASIKVNQAFLYNLAGQSQAALSAAGEALILFEQLGQAYGRSVAAQNLAEAHLALGNLSEAERFARRVIQEEERVILPDGLRVLGEIRLAQGNLTEAHALIQQSIDLARQNQDKFLEAYALRALGGVCAAEDDPVAAKTALAEAVRLFEMLDAPQEVARTALLIVDC